MWCSMLDLMWTSSQCGTVAVFREKEGDGLFIWGDSLPLFP